MMTHPHTDTQARFPKARSPHGNGLCCAPLPRHRLPTAVDDVAHDRGQRCTRPRTTSSTAVGNAQHPFAAGFSRRAAWRQAGQKARICLHATQSPRPSQLRHGVAGPQGAGMLVASLPCGRGLWSVQGWRSGRQRTACSADAVRHDFHHTAVGYVHGVGTDAREGA